MKRIFSGLLLAVYILAGVTIFPVKADNDIAVYTQSAVSCTITAPAEGASVPKKAYNVVGQITSEYPLERVVGYLDGTRFAVEEMNGAKSLDLKYSAINNLSFSALAPGKHTMVIQVSDIYHGELVTVCTRNFVTQGTVSCSHNYTQTPSPAATCTQSGVMKYTCTKCATTYTVTMASGHHYVKGACTLCGQVKSYNLTLQADQQLDISLQQDLYVDLNGYTLTGTIQTNGYKVYGVDSTTNQYSCEQAGVFACVDKKGDSVIPEKLYTTQDGLRYLTIQDDAGYRFHRFYVGITHYSLDTSTCGIGFKAQLWGSDAVMKQLTSGRSLEYHLQLEEHPTYSTFFTKDKLYSGRTISLRVNNWDLEQYADATLRAGVSLNLADGTAIHSEETELTFRGTVEQIDSDVTNYTQKQLDAIGNLMERYPIMLTWGLQNLPTKCQQHTDADNNGYCDICTNSVLVKFQVFAMNDLHGKFNDTSKQIGVDEFTTYIKNTRKKGNVILLSSGDMWQGGAESNLTHGQIVTDWMNELDFVSMTMGNHEYDWGRDPIEANAQLAEFPFLGINIYERSTDSRVSYCDSSVMVDFGDLQVGIIGAIGNCYSSIATGQASDVYFKTGSQLTSLVKAEAQKLRQQGADFIIYSLHDGYENGNTGTSATTVSSLGYYDMSLSNGYVDLVFEGHTHQRYLLKDSYGVYHIQGGGDNSGFSQATVTVNVANGNSTVSDAKSLKTSTYSSLAPDPLIAALLEKYKDLITPAYEILGYNASKRNSKTVCDLVSQLYLQAGLEKWGDQYDIYLGGGFLQCRSPYNIYAGQVQYQDLMSILPFDNQIVLCKIPGNSLLTNFINSTNDDYHITLSDYGKSTTPVNNSLKFYYVITDTYTANYSKNKMTIVETYDATTFARDLLAEYIRQGKLAK